MSDIKLNTPDVFELRNKGPIDDTGDPPTLLLESGIWTTADGDKSGVTVSVFGQIAPLVEPRDVLRLAKWLTDAANALCGEKKNIKKKKPNNHYEEDDDGY